MRAAVGTVDVACPRNVPSARTRATVRPCASNRARPPTGCDLDKARAKCVARHASALLERRANALLASIRLRPCSHSVVGLVAVLRSFILGAVAVGLIAAYIAGLPRTRNRPALYGLGSLRHQTLPMSKPRRVPAAMKIAILSRNSKLYSTRRLIEAGRKRGHTVRILDPLRCYMRIAADASACTTRASRSPASMR